MSASDRIDEEDTVHAMTDAEKILEINRHRLGLVETCTIDETVFCDATEASRRLCVYGRMRPGGPDHHVLAAYGGTWDACKIRGFLQSTGASSEGLEGPGLAWSPKGELQDGSLLTSSALLNVWRILDDHEGDGYARLLAAVETAEGIKVANVYASADASRTQIMLLDGLNVHDDLD